MKKGTAKDVATIVAAAGEIVGRTRLQKTATLLELTGTGFKFPFTYHLYGPYSEELVVATDRAVALDYIDEQEKRAEWGGKFTVFSAPEKIPSGNPARDQLIELARSADSIILELAVTAAFLASEGEDDPWAELEARKPQKITRARLSKAKALYREFMTVPVPNPLPQIV